ncbi:MAG: hypothetical protein Kow00120_14560 [Anaerolineae bacterium]
MSKNIITNGSFDGQFQHHEGIPEIAVAPGWTPWWHPQSPGDEVWKNRRPEFKSAPIGVDARRVRLGESCQMYATPWGTHIAGLYQQVHVPEGATLRFACYGMAWSSEGDDPHVSENPGNMRMRVGIDPKGGADPFASTVVWSRERAVYDAFEAFTVEAAAENTLVTVFTYSAPDWPKKHNEVFWDDASLEVVNGAAAREPGPKGVPKAGLPVALFLEAPGRLVNETVQVRATGPLGVGGVILHVYGPYGEVQADWFGSELGGRGQIWKWSFVPRKAGHYMVRFKGTGADTVDGGIYIFDPPDGPPPDPGTRGAPREQYERTYILMPPNADRPWLDAVINSAILEDHKHTLGFSADDAGIGDLDQRRVLLINPVGWREPLEIWFARYYPGVKVRTLNASTPDELEIALKIGMGSTWD